MKSIALIIISAAILLIMAGLIVFERKKTDTVQLVLTAVMTAMAVAGRIVFAVLPGFKPVTAVVIIAGVYLGKQSGFVCGALSALVSNFYFGQGPWTPFQMLIWGITGVVAALASESLIKRKWLLVIFSALSGVIFSLFMDIYTVIWTLGQWSFAFYITAVMASFSYMAVYAASNVFFVVVIHGFVGKKLMRAMEKSHQSYPC